MGTYNFYLDNFRYDIQNFLHNFDSSDLAGMGIAGVILGVIFSFFAVWVLLWIANYIFERLGLMRICRNAGIPNPGLMFIPLAKTYYMGMLAQRSRYARTGERTPLAKIYFFCTLGAWLLGSGLLFLVFSGTYWLYLLLTWALRVFLLVLKYYVRYYIFADYAPDNDVLFTVLTALPLAEPILLLVLRDVVPVSVAGRRPTGQPKYMHGRPDNSYTQYGAGPTDSRSDAPNNNEQGE